MDGTQGPQERSTKRDRQGLGLRIKSSLGKLDLQGSQLYIRGESGIEAESELNIVLMDLKRVTRGSSKKYQVR